MTGAFQATAFQNSAFQVEAVGAEVPSGGGASGGSRAYRKRLREAAERRQRFEEEHWRRIAAIGTEVERPELEPAPETVAMLAEVHEAVSREIDDSEEEELLLLLLAA